MLMKCRKCDFAICTRKYFWQMNFSMKSSYEVWDYSERSVNDTNGVACLINFHLVCVCVCVVFIIIALLFQVGKNFFCSRKEKEDDDKFSFVEKCGGEFARPKTWHFSTTLENEISPCLVKAKEAIKLINIPGRWRMSPCAMKVVNQLSN